MTAPPLLQRVATSPILIKFMRLHLPSIKQSDSDHFFLNQDELVESALATGEGNAPESKRVTQNELHWLQIRTLLDRTYLLIFLLLLVYHQMCRINKPT
jgi:hypothetical protein